MEEQEQEQEQEEEMEIEQEQEQVPEACAINKTQAKAFCPCRQAPARLQYSREDEAPKPLAPQLASNVPPEAPCFCRWLLRALTKDLASSGLPFFPLADFVQLSGSLLFVFWLLLSLTKGSQQRSSGWPCRTIERPAHSKLVVLHAHAMLKQQAFWLSFESLTSSKSLSMLYLSVQSLGVCRMTISSVRISRLMPIWPSSATRLRVDHDSHLPLLPFAAFSLICTDKTS